MVIKFGNLGNKLLTNLMYKDRLTCHKKESSTTRNPDGSISSKLLHSFLQNEPCLVHETTEDYSKDGNLDVARQEVVVTVYCSNLLDIKRGDFLELSVLNDMQEVTKLIKGYAGQPTQYPDHLEINLYDWKVS